MSDEKPRPSSDHRRLQQAAFFVAFALCATIIVVFVAVTIRLGYQALTGPQPRGDALKSMWAFIGAAIAAAVTLTGLLFTRAQADRTERRLKFENERTDKRLNLDTAVEGLKLLAMPSGAKGYAPSATVAGAIATLAHLEHPVIAMRALGPAWNDCAVDTPSATWLISEVLASDSEQAKLEAATLLDAHAHELCGDTYGSFSWPDAIAFSWPRADFAARLRIHHAILTTLMSRSRAWWREGAREGWAMLLLYRAIERDDNVNIKAHAAFELELLLGKKGAKRTDLTEILDRGDWCSVSKIEVAMNRAQNVEERRMRLLRRQDELLAEWVERRDDGSSEPERHRNA